MLQLLVRYLLWFHIEGTANSNVVHNSGSYLLRFRVPGFCSAVPDGPADWNIVRGLPSNRLHPITQLIVRVRGGYDIVAAHHGFVLSFVGNPQGFRMFAG